MLGGLNLKVVKAVVKRDLRMYFSNPAGYVFITLFIFLSAAAAFWQERFFLNNLANLDNLNGLFPYLLLFFVPALTMSVWSEERKLGTDELLLTLPASDLEIVLGKYFATLGVYTASLALSLSHVVVLFWLGSPDVGLMIGNYLGYWLTGAALIAVGMLASLMTANATISFILGALFCSIFVLLDSTAGLLSESLGRVLGPVVVHDHFADFSRGVVSLSGLAYFASVTALLIYLNVLLLSRRHWPREASGFSMGLHHLVRAAAVAVILVSVNAVVARASVRLDVTAERLHTLSAETKSLIAELSPDRPVFVQAFLSPDVPEQFVQTKADLLDILHEIDVDAGPRVEVLIQETEPYTEAAQDAREKFGITPKQIPSFDRAQAGFDDVFLGVAFTCGAEEEVIPFFDRGLPAEYEIARSIRVVAKTDRKKVGVVDTELRLFGGMDFKTFQNNPPWSVVDELKKQYEVEQISPATPITEELDALLVVLPSSLSQEEMDNVSAYVENGHPALFLVDPLPLVNPGLAPSERAGANRNPFMQQGAPPKEKGNVQQMLADLGVRWNPGAVVWDAYNPHPDLAHLPPEVVFIGAGNANPQAFSPASRVTEKLQELVFLYPGELAPSGKDGLVFAPLLESGTIAGELSYPQLVSRSFFGSQINRNVPHRPMGQSYTIAAQVRSAGAAEKGGDTAGGGDAAEGNGEEKASTSAGKIDVIVVADIDFISEQFFEIRKAGPANLDFDNVTFALNAMDVLVGDEAFIDLRNHRLRHRTLRRVEDRTRQFIEHRAKEQEQAEADAKKALEQAQARLDEKVEEVRQRPDLDDQTKQIMARNLQEAENRRFEVQKANIELEKQAKLHRSEEEMEMQVRRIESGIRTSAVLLPPVPVLALGAAIFVRRRRREREGAAASHRLRG